MTHIFHVHTFRCKHGSEELDEDYIKTALSLGAQKITFTEHCPFPGNPFRKRMDLDQLPESGIRPCTVVSNDQGNANSSVYIVVPLTSQHKKYLPTHVEVAENSYALCEQVTTVSEQQVLRKKKECITEEKQNAIDRALKVAMDL